jgi:hypothetical protein
MSFLAIGIIWSQDCTRQNLTLFEITGIQTAKTDKNHVKDINRGATLGTFNKKHSKPLTKQDSSWSRDGDGVLFRSLSSWLENALSDLNVVSGLWNPNMASRFAGADFRKSSSLAVACLCLRLGIPQYDETRAFHCLSLLAQTDRTCKSMV